MNSIDAKGYKFLQQNKPGNDGYGQIGLKGESGEDGNSVYFTSYALNDRSNFEICKTLIKEGKELSNNPNYDSKNIVYKINDIILDKIGDVYILKSWTDTNLNNNSEDNTIEHETPFNIVKLNNIFAEGSITGSQLNCDLKIVFSDTESEFYYKKHNDNYLGEYNNKTGSPHIYHRDRYQSEICGGWLSFSLPNPEHEYYNFVYKYVLLLPNGQRIEKVTSTSSCIMFLDNRYFYSCRFNNEDTTIIDLTNVLKEIVDYHSIQETGEYNPEFTYKLLTNGINLCKAYVEITNRDTHNVYRLYADTIDTTNVENI